MREWRDGRRNNDRNRLAGAHAITQNIDTDDSNPMARFLLHILAAFAELEWELIRERVTAGVRAAKARGRQVGRPKRIFRRDEAVRLRERRVRVGER